ncbi:MAG: amino acid ABC transporter ATP-binding protein [Candidatus Brocadiaceae bacterium]|nr:amino acid ABC transporter ATP-binding protein [Candidatus Brocadiaceae bacterium]
MINIRNVFKQFNLQPLFNGLNLNVSRGSVVSLIGPSGSGKSTFLRCINGLEPFQRGSISVNGQTLYGVKEQEYHSATVKRAIKNVRCKVGMVFQQFNLFPHISVLQNIIKAPVLVLGIDRAKAESQAVSLLKKVRLEEKAKKYPGELSGGEQQRVAIARALAMNPEVMLFDEPTSSLDPEMIEEVLQVIRDLVSGGMTTIIATHEMGFAKDVSSQVLFLEKGSFVECGSPDEIFYHPKNDRTKAYLNRFMK